MEDSIIHFSTKKIMNNYENQDEIWKPIIKYEGYEVSNFGRVRSISRNIIDKNGKTIYRNGKLLSQNKINSGYLMVDFNINGIHKRELIHRIVAEVFIENPNNLPEVNHKDNNKLNNKVENLEWCDGIYNKTYSNVFNKGAEAVKRKIIMVDLQNNIKEYNSIAEAAKDLNISHGTIGFCLKEGRTTKRGYSFYYKD